ncbi:hypothetical protein AB4559_02220 [Vibrio sp. 10N.222.51.C8]|uniref:hypothetical protein n=2 Tax=Vibrio TaxID=662 RepID=UPI000C81800F|nr:MULTISPECIES: hypothetical protein [unclassified Vibrio]PMO01660.1 hypothetical protein BCT20_11450 [Vibrio sp. 10N.222.55.C12]PMO02816.1 hypothetical protein BCT21_07225 [Vibrio sp. 10N.222.55.F9]PMO13577.1 hypothetical protein BCT17_14310 [Vibrio sp. 10N.222.54.F10]PMO14656.1 hypothetical protein BCT16_18910 [Vibrio sp. 10N.222.54.B6]TKF41175.1 hypothetical protein FCV49_17950 [Vibrio sp. F13]
MDKSNLTIYIEKLKNTQKSDNRFPSWRNNISLPEYDVKQLCTMAIILTDCRKRLGRKTRYCEYPKGLRDYLETIRGANLNQLTEYLIPHQPWFGMPEFHAQPDSVRAERAIEEFCRLCGITRMVRNIERNVTLEEVYARAKFVGSCSIDELQNSCPDIRWFIQHNKLTIAKALNWKVQLYTNQYEQGTFYRSRVEAAVLPLIRHYLNTAGYEVELEVPYQECIERVSCPDKADPSTVRSDAYIHHAPIPTIIELYMSEDGGAPVTDRYIEQKRRKVVYLETQCEKLGLKLGGDIQLLGFNTERRQRTEFALLYKEIENELSIHFPGTSALGHQQVVNWSKAVQLFYISDEEKQLAETEQVLFTDYDYPMSFWSELNKLICQNIAMSDVRWKAIRCLDKHGLLKQVSRKSEYSWYDTSHRRGKIDSHDGNYGGFWARSLKALHEQRVQTTARPKHVRRFGVVNFTLTPETAVCIDQNGKRNYVAAGSSVYLSERIAEALRKIHQEHGVICVSDRSMYNVDYVGINDRGEYIVNSHSLNVDKLAELISIYALNTYGFDPVPGKKLRSGSKTAHIAGFRFSEFEGDISNEKEILQEITATARKDGGLKISDELKRLAVLNTIDLRKQTKTAASKHWVVDSEENIRRVAHVYASMMENLNAPATEIESTGFNTDCSGTLNLVT